MMKLVTVLTSAALLSAPAYAQPGPVQKPAVQPQSCEMAHGTHKMQGVMVKGADGKMACQMKGQAMAGHAGMDHGAHSPDQSNKDAHAEHHPK